MKVAILDDYQNVALQLADWSRVPVCMRRSMCSTIISSILRAWSSACSDRSAAGAPNSRGRGRRRGQHRKMDRGQRSVRIGVCDE
jgi:hypothetical protein